MSPEGWRDFSVCDTYHIGKRVCVQILAHRLKKKKKKSMAIYDNPSTVEGRGREHWDLLAAGLAPGSLRDPDSGELRQRVIELDT